MSDQDIRADALHDGRPTAAAFAHAPTANAVFGKLLYDRLADGEHMHAQARRQFRTTYWILVGLWMAMFLVGLALILIPLLRNGGTVTSYSPTDATMTALGGADLLSFLILQPTNRIKRLAGDAAQMTVVLTDHQVGIALRVIAMDGRDKKTITACADHVLNLTTHTSRLIEEFFRTGPTDDKAVHKVQAQADAVRARIQDALRDGPLDDDTARILGEAEESLDHLEKTSQRVLKRPMRRILGA